MPAFLLDTSCMVAAVCAWHEHHERATEELERRFSRGETMIVAAPALIEAYAVLTRLPPPHRVSPADAVALLETNFVREAKTVALDANSYRALLREASRDGIAGGRIYDSVIVACALKVNVSALLTLNANHFLPFATRRLDIVVPGERTE